MGKGSASGDRPDAEGGGVGDDETVAATPASTSAAEPDSSATDATVAATPATSSPAAGQAGASDRDAETRSFMGSAAREADTRTLGEAATEHAGAVAVTPTGASGPAVRRGGASLRRGDRLEQFLILEELGAGGMGVVVAAHDPDLDRKVAIKVLRTEQWAEDSESAGRLRLLREAQAMAKLQHPNVITVHEVGTVDDQVFVAMEFVDGWTLGEWLEQESRSWRDIVAKFVDAGRGLAAAHHAGLVHRDFKPANVLVGKDGRVRVTDFGLVGAVEGAEQVFAAPAQPDAESSGLMSSSGAGTPLAMTLTNAGQILGTPVYMAPEQHMGQKTDARADQFAFAVALYEALVGRRPFSRGHGYQDLATNVCRGKVRPIPREAGVPLWLQKVVLRGLEVDPDQRFPSMDEMLVALQKDPAVARRRGAGIAGVVVLAGLAGFGLLRGHGGDHGPRCERGGARLAGVWDESVKQQVHDRFVATGVSYAEDTYGRVARALDDYTAKWQAMHKDACEATHVRGEQSGQLLDLRMRCLGRRLGSLGALTRQLTREADAGTLGKAVQAALELDPVAGCADTEALTAAVPPPEDPMVRDKVAELRTRLDDVEALGKLGKSEQGIEAAEKVVAEARQAGYPPLLADALYQLGELETVTGKPDRAEPTLREAARVAAEAGDDETIAKAWTRLVYVVGYQKAKYPEALEIASLAEVAVARSGGSDRIAGLFDKNLAVVLAAKGDLTGALARGQRAAKELERGYGSEHPLVAGTVFNLAIDTKNAGDVDEAERLYRKAIAIYERVLGADHPKVANALSGLAGVFQLRGDLDSARKVLSRVLDIHERTLGPDDPRLAASLDIMAGVLLQEGEAAGAEAHARRAYEIWSRALGADHPNVTMALSTLGNALLQQGRIGEARGCLETVLRVREKSLGADHPLVVAALVNLGRVALSEKHWDEAREVCGGALVKGEGTAQPDYSVAVRGMVCVARAEMGLGRTSAALRSLDSARELGERNHLPHATMGKIEFLRAQCVWPRNRDEAVGLAKKARAEFLDARVVRKDKLAEIDDWLRRHSSGH